jgi:hypothetical protein
MSMGADSILNHNSEFSSSIESYISDIKKTKLHAYTIHEDLYV